ncbi:MAG: hypothetical protein U0Q16_22915 [Bryobacteraceae bacterium]
MLPLVLCAAIQVGSLKQLFIDHKFIESAEGIRLTAHAPVQTHEKLVTPDQPWERDTRIGSYSTVVDENGKVRLWYNVHAGEPEPGKNPPFMGMAYAESRDGLHFAKPVLGLVERNGSRENNLVMPPDPKLLTVGGGTVWIDENPRAKPDARYRSWSKLYPAKGSGIRGPHRVWSSPDGLHWKLDETLVTGLRAADTQPSWFWDSRVGRYIGYSREWVREKSGFGARMASYNESDDLFHWDSTYFALGPDERDNAVAPAVEIDAARMLAKGEDVIPPAAQRRAAETGGADQVLTPTSPLDFYGPGVFPYEGVYIALIPVFHHWRGDRHESWPSTSDVQLAVSRDGRHFTRPGNREPFLRTGPDGSWDSKWLYPVLRPIRRGGELWIYYFGTNHDHAGRLDAKAKAQEGAISRAILRADGFVAAEAEYEGGTMMTPPIEFQGKRLELNLDTGAGGVARVEIVEESGKPIPGYALTDADAINGDNVRAVASWGGRSDVSVLAGKPVRLRFKMRSARLYAFQFVP